MTNEMADVTTLSSVELIPDRLSDKWETRSAASQEGCGYTYNIKQKKNEKPKQSGPLKEKDKAYNFKWKYFFF